MKWLKPLKNGEIKFDDYFEYIDSIQKELPINVYKFASNWDMYSLESRSSLHDSWLLNISIEELRDNPKKRFDSCNISVTLLGAFHDRKICLKYLNVSKYLLNSDLSSDSTQEKDLTVHEFRLNKNNQIEHEIQFSNDSSLEITFADMDYEEVKI